MIMDEVVLHYESSKSSSGLTGSSSLVSLVKESDRSSVITERTSSISLFSDEQSTSGYSNGSNENGAIGLCLSPWIDSSDPSLGKLKEIDLDDGFRLDGSETSASISGTTPAELLDQVEVEVAPKRDKPATLELSIGDLGCGSAFQARSSWGSNLFWAPERTKSLWVMGWNTVWSLSGPLLEGLLVPQHRRSLRELTHASCQPYLEASKLSCTSIPDGEYMIRKVFQEQVYGSKTLLQDVVGHATCIVDVGANVGAFAAWAAATHNNFSNTKRQLIIVCLEPVPETAAACKQNATRAMMKHPNVDIQVVPVGLSTIGSQSGSTKLTYIQGMPSLSTSCPQEEYYHAILQPLLNSERAFVQYYNKSHPTVCALMQLSPFHVIRQTMRELAVAWLWRFRPLQVRMGSLLEAFHRVSKNNTQSPWDPTETTIDLLKVDLGVLLTCFESWWWAKIQNVLVEVALGTTTQRFMQAVEFLESKAFITIVSLGHPEELGTSPSHMIFAKRGP